MYYTMHVFAYDALTRVTAHLSVREYDDEGVGREESVLQRSVEFDGVGCSDPEEWVKDALVALIEVL